MAKSKLLKLNLNSALVIILIIAGVIIFFKTFQVLRENKVLKEVVSRLEAESRIAEVLVTKVEFDENTKKQLTTIKFLEYNAQGNALEPKYFTFSGNIIQFQSLVIRFDDIFIRKKDLFRGKSAYLFWKVFMLDGHNTQEYDITKINEIPLGYKVNGETSLFEANLWKNFWRFALDPNKASYLGVKNAQIEAPGTMFVPGVIYTIKIEHDGGIRIDTSLIPDILKGERIPKK